LELHWDFLFDDGSWELGEPAGLSRRGKPGGSLRAGGEPEYSGIRRVRPPGNSPGGIFRFCQQSPKILAPAAKFLMDER